MIAVGEESGSLPDLLDEVSDFYDGEVEYDLSRLTASIEPILIMFIAVLVLILALGVFLPIWDLGRSRAVMIIRDDRTIATQVKLRSVSRRLNLGMQDRM